MALTRSSRRQNQEGGKRSSRKPCERRQASDPAGHGSARRGWGTLPCHLVHGCALGVPFSDACTGFRLRVGEVERLLRPGEHTGPPPGFRSWPAVRVPRCGGFGANLHPCVREEWILYPEKPGRTHSEMLRRLKRLARRRVPGLPLCGRPGASGRDERRLPPTAARSDRGSLEARLRDQGVSERPAIGRCPAPPA
jgi:hypothetical protein